MPTTTMGANENFLSYMSTLRHRKRGKNGNEKKEIIRTHV